MPNPSCANQSTVNVCVLASETERRAYFIARPHHCIRQGSHFPYITLILKKKKIVLAGGCTDLFPHCGIDFLVFRVVLSS